MFLEHHVSSLIAQLMDVLGIHTVFALAAVFETTRDVKRFLKNLPIRVQKAQIRCLQEAWIEAREVHNDSFAVQ